MELLIGILLLLVGCWLVLTVLPTALPALALGVGAEFLVQMAVLLFWLALLGSTGQLTRLVRIELGEGKVNVRLDDSRMIGCAQLLALFAIPVSTTVGAGITYGIVRLIHSKRWFVDADSSGTVMFFFDWLLTALGFIYLSLVVSFGWTDLIPGFIRRLRFLTQAVVKRKLGTLSVQLDQIEALGAEVAQLARQLDAHFPADYASSIQSFADANKARLLADSSELSSFISGQSERAREDRDQLRKAASQYDSAMQEYREALSMVFTSGSVALTTLLDDTYVALTDLRGLLAQRDWTAFAEGISSITKKLRAISRNADELRDLWEDGDLAVRDPYDVLGVSPEMSDDKIRKVYRQLCKIYHPDIGTVKDDRRIKEIIIAYEQILGE
jgi:hypothetical protein